MNSQKKETTFPMAVREMKENILAHIEFSQLQAKVQRAKYLALIEHGFTEEQAIILCK